MQFPMTFFSEKKGFGRVYMQPFGDYVQPPCKLIFRGFHKQTHMQAHFQSFVCNPWVLANKPLTRYCSEGFVHNFKVRPFSDGFVCNTLGVGTQPENKPLLRWVCIKLLKVVLNSMQAPFQKGLDATLLQAPFLEQFAGSLGDCVQLPHNPFLGRNCTQSLGFCEKHLHKPFFKWVCMLSFVGNMQPLCMLFVRGV